MDPKLLNIFKYHIMNYLSNSRERRETFKYWPAGFISPNELAAEGLFYSRNEDCCMCVFCWEIYDGWKKGCSVKEKHYKKSPDCFKFVMKHKANDLWKGPKTFYRDPYGKDKCGHEVAEKFINNCKKDRIVIDNSQKNSVHLDDFENAGIYQHQNEHTFPEYANKSDRLTTFDKWPKNVMMHQSPEDLAEAGFLYTGIGDFVACFSCGKIIGNFENDDIAWIEHAKFKPYCPYLLYKKNPRFVKRVHTFFKFDPNTGKFHNSKMTKITATGAATRTVVGAVGTGAAEKLTPSKSSSSTSSSSSSDYSPIVIFYENETSTGERERVCKICFFNPADVIFTPCTHMVACYSCVSDLDSCPICREKIDIAFKPYLNLKIGKEYSQTKEVENFLLLKDQHDQEKSTKTNIDVDEILVKEKEKTKRQQINNVELEKNEEKKKKNKKKKVIYTVDKCKKCSEEPAEIVFLPCTHMILCASCTLLVEDCPSCNEKIKYAFRPI